MNLKNTLYTITIPCLLLFNCKQKKSSEITEINNPTDSIEITEKIEKTKIELDTIKTIEKEKVEINIEDISTDTLTVSGKHIVFFSITQSEFDAYEKDVNSGVNEVLSDFEYYANNSANTLKENGFKLTMTASRFIKFKMDNDSEIVFDRFNEDEDRHIVGRLYSDGQKMTTSYGVATDIDILMELEDFLKNKNGL